MCFPEQVTHPRAVFRDLGRDSKEVDGIVLKHGRVSTVKNVRFVTPRSQLLD